MFALRYWTMKSRIFRSISVSATAPESDIRRPAAGVASRSDVGSERANGMPLYGSESAWKHVAAGYPNVGLKRVSRKGLVQRARTRSNA